ncbi:class I SAM-dependent methyltransferase [Brevibacillus dissolubilis]|uniref:class I SAM-dependent methyltransferase n=1 Tax=Brevibacillus dissolubilis TaxID=1844116 RepID=UPI00111739FF|nr:class I SAM-dependent methyltransferase [Brevibacillus dissolubilis]
MNQEWNDEVVKKWNKNAEQWDRDSIEMWDTGSRKTILPLLKQLVSTADGTILDAGCGAGYGSWKLARDGYRVIGVDISQEMIQYAKSRPSEGLSLEFRVGDVGRLSLTDEEAAGILSINVVEFTESPLDTLLEFRRVLKPGGMLLLGILGPTAGPRAYSFPRLYGKPTIQNTMMPWEAKQLAEENGYELVSEHPVYKEGVTDEIAEQLDPLLREAVSFLTVFVLRKVDQP